MVPRRGDRRVQTAAEHDLAGGNNIAGWKYLQNAPCFTNRPTRVLANLLLSRLPPTAEGLGQERDMAARFVALRAAASDLDFAAAMAARALPCLYMGRCYFMTLSLD